MELNFLGHFIFVNNRGKMSTRVSLRPSPLCGFRFIEGRLVQAEVVFYRDVEVDLFLRRRTPLGTRRS